MNPFSTASEMLAALDNRQVSARELVELHRERYLRFNEQLNALVTPNFEQAAQAAAEADARRDRGVQGPLLGLPLTIKDAINVAGLPTTGGTLDPAQATAAEDALVVQRLKAAGGIILGKSNTPVGNGDWQSNNPVFGRSRNPWNLERTPGGSTGGGAAAVAAGLSPLEFGSDIGGSIRIPAAFCGLYGHKPSATLVPRSGHFPSLNTPNPGQLMGVQGPLARSAADLRLAMAIIRGPEALESKGWQLQLPPPRHDRLSDYRVGVLQLPEWCAVDEEILFAREQLIRQLESAGATVKPVSATTFGDFRRYYENYLVLLQCIVGGGLAKEQRQRAAEKLRAKGDRFMDAVAGGLLASAGKLMKLLEVAEGYKAHWETVFTEVDVLLAPANMVNAFTHDDAYLYDRELMVNGQPQPYAQQSFLPALATLAGLPATAVPVAQSREGLPIGLQVIGAYLEDETTIQFAELVEQAFGGFKAPSAYSA